MAFVYSNGSVWSAFRSDQISRPAFRTALRGMTSVLKALCSRKGEPKIMRLTPP
nr:MAG TPA_asm: hypothetical protein [Caudoviricetes sp.]